MSKTRYSFILRWENIWKYASFAEMNMIRMNIIKAQLLSFEIWNMRYSFSKFCNSNLLKSFTLIKRFCLSCVFFFDFSIPTTTETTHHSCSFQFMCSIQILTMMLDYTRVKNSLWALLNLRLFKEFFLPILSYFLTRHICNIRLT